MKIYTKTFTLLLSIGLLQGCSGHALQDLVDGDKSEVSSPLTTQQNSVKKQTPPSQNSALLSISPSPTATDEHEEYRYIQKNTNDWLENEWDPLTETKTSDVEKSNSPYNDNHKMIDSDSNTSSKNEDNSSTGLQYYVDKAAIYIENKEARDANKTKAPSHVDKVNAMPGIGKKTTR